MESNAFQRWNSDLANVIAHVGDPIFFQQVFAAIEAQVPVAYPQAWLYHKDLPPQLYKFHGVHVPHVTAHW